MTDLPATPDAAATCPHADHGAVLRQLAVRAAVADTDPDRPRSRRRRARRAVPARLPARLAGSVPAAESPAPPARPWRSAPNIVRLVVATEPDGLQRLVVGWWRHESFGQVKAEGLVVGGHLTAEEVDAVGLWGAAHRSAVRYPVRPENAYLQLLTAADFTDSSGPLYRQAIRGNPGRANRLYRGATLAGYDMAFTLSRFARYTGPARDASGSFRGGMSIALAGGPGGSRPWVDPPGYPRLRARQLNADTVLLSWAADKLMAEDGVLPGWILDLRHLGAAMAGLSGPAFDTLCYWTGIDDPGPQPAWDPLQPGSDGAGITGLLDWLEKRLDAEAKVHSVLEDEVTAWNSGINGGTRLRPQHLYSGGSFASKLFYAAGFKPAGPRAELPPEVTGAFAGAFHGGRSEASLLRHPTPMVIADFSANYLTAASLLGVADLLRPGQRIVAVDATDELAAWLDDLAADPDPVTTLTDPTVWSRWGSTVAMVEPAGEWLPHRALTGPGEVASTFAPLSSPTPLPYCWADLAAAVVKGGRAPRVLRAWRLVTEPVRQAEQPDQLGQPGQGEEVSKGVKVPGTDIVLSAADTDLDPFVRLLHARSELRQAAIAADGAGDPAGARVLQRREAAVKRAGNSAAYGNLSRTDRNPRSPDDDPIGFLDPWGGHFETRPVASETPGRWTFMPAASSVTAAARLLIVCAERRVFDAGGTIAGVLTDSLVVPAHPDGGLWPCPGGPEVTDDAEPAVRLLGWDRLAGLLAPFDRLRLDGGRAWKIGEHHTATDPAHPLQVIIYGANRYVVFDPGTGRVVHNTESHLGGTLLDPTGGGGDKVLDDGRRAWVAELLGWLPDLVGTADPDSVPGEARAGRWPSWARRPAVSAWPAATLRQLAWLRNLPGMAEAQPFTRFLLAHPGGVRMGAAGSNTTTGEPDVDGDTQRSPIAAYDPDPNRWAGARWCHRDGRPARFVLDNPQSAIFTGVFEAATVAEQASRWRQGGDFGARPVAPSALSHLRGGLYRRVPTEALGAVALIGREGDLMVEADRQVVGHDERLSVLAEPGEYVCDVAADTVRELVRRHRPALRGVLPERTLRSFLAGRDLGQRNAAKLLGALDRIVLDLLLAAGVDAATLAESPRGIPYELARRLDAGTAVVARKQVVTTCLLPGCAKPRRVSYPYCSRTHEEQSQRLATVRCEFPDCCEKPVAGGRFCSDRHRKAAEARRYRDRKTAGTAAASNQKTHNTQGEHANEWEDEY